MVKKVAAVKSQCKFLEAVDILRLLTVKLPCKGNNIPKQFEISDRLEFTSGLM